MERFRSKLDCYGACTGVAIALLPIGWCAIIPCDVLGFLLHWLFQKYKVFDRKSHKEKVYKEYKLNEKSSIEELKSLRRKIRKQILEEKLHPDKWPSDIEAEKIRKIFMVESNYGFIG